MYKNLHTLYIFLILITIALRRVPLKVLCDFCLSEEKRKMGKGISITNFQFTIHN
jgi:hypothetical protein